MPLYLKSHSYGEYVFDWGWAEAYERAGGRYYPKLQAAVPFTPVTGRRLLVRPDAPLETSATLAATAVRLAERLGVSSMHVTFPTENEIAMLQQSGFLVRLGYQFHWENRGYSSFEKFLSDLASRKRKALRKERQSVAASGIVLRTLTGPDIKERHWDAFWRFYLDTADRKWGHPYLNRAFFGRLGETMADRVVLVMAETQAGEPVGGALNLLGQDALHGRYWGSTEACRFLHFEACYYRAIDFAIETRTKARRGRRAGRAQGAAWLSAAAHMERSLDRVVRAPPGGAALPCGGASGGRGDDTGACGGVAVSPSRPAFAQGYAFLSRAACIMPPCLPERFSSPPSFPPPSPSAPPPPHVPTSNCACCFCRTMPSSYWLTAVARVAR